MKDMNNLDLMLDVDHKGKSGVLALGTVDFSKASIGKTLEISR